jgi:hypothetical protein
LVIRFTNALPFYFIISTLHLFTPVKPSLALKATDYAVALGIRLEVHGRENGLQRCLCTALDEHGLGGERERFSRSDCGEPTSGLEPLTSSYSVLADPAACRLRRRLSESTGRLSSRHQWRRVSPLLLRPPASPRRCASRRRRWLRGHDDAGGTRRTTTPGSGLNALPLLTVRAFVQGTD